MKGPYLLDVNVLIALLDSGHANHDVATNWFKDAKKRGWRTCAVTEMGVLRVMTGAKYMNPFPMEQVRHNLEVAKQDGDHGFWDKAFSLSAWLEESELAVPSVKVTDAYLLKLADRMSGTLATFDRRIAVRLIGVSEERVLEHIGTQH